MGRFRFPARVVSLVCLGQSVLLVPPSRAGEATQDAARVAGATAIPVEVSGFRSVKFVPEDPGQSFLITVDSSLTCRTPCDLPLADGEHTLEVSGDAAFAHQIVVGDATSVVTIEKTHHYGLALILAGTGVAITGFFLNAVPRAPCDPHESPGCEPGSDGNAGVRNLGRAMLVAGGLCGITGLVLGSIRTSRLQVEGSPVARSDGAAPEAFEPRLVGLGVGPVGDGVLAVGATFSF